MSGTVATIDLVRRRVLPSALTAGLLLFAAACAHHVQLKVPETERAAGPGYVCSATTHSEAKCKDATEVDPAQQNQSGTAFVILPPQCEGRFHQVTIEDADSSEPTVHVLCAAQENVLQ
jgi:hypothetical protein